MSRSSHVLRCAAWWGACARWFYGENRERRQWLRRRMEHARRRWAAEDFEDAMGDAWARDWEAIRGDFERVRGKQP